MGLEGVKVPMKGIKMRFKGDSLRFIKIKHFINL